MIGFNQIMYALKRIKIIMRSIVKRAVVTRAGNDSEAYNKCQVSYGFPLKTADTEVVSPYGLYVNLPEELQVILFAVCGDEGNKAAIGYSQDDRFKNLKEGEVLIGNPQTQSFVKFSENGDITVDAKGKIIINSTGDVDLTAQNVNVDATQVNLGTGGNDIARLGDSVQVSLITGSGTITSAGTNTSI